MLVSRRLQFFLIGVSLLDYSFAAAAGDIIRAALIRNHGSYEIVSNLSDLRALATASYLDTNYAASGWGQLSIATTEGVIDAQQLYAAGMSIDWQSILGSAIHAILDNDQSQQRPMPSVRNRLIRQAGFMPTMYGCALWQDF